MRVLQDRLTPSEIEVLKQIEGKLNLSEEEIIQLMDLRKILFGGIVKEQIKPIKDQQEEILKLLGRIDYFLQKAQGITTSVEIKKTEEESKFKELELEIKKLDKTYFIECIRQIDNGIQILQRRQFVGQPAATLMYSLEFALLMAIIYVKTMNFEPKFEEHFRKQLQALRNL